MLELPKGLRYGSDEQAGYHRSADAKTFQTTAGEPCTDEAALERAAAMVIPPQWSDVWIAKSANSHLQCTGRDARGRKQYIYHDRYVEFRQRAKFQKLIPFAEALPTLRKQVAQDLKHKSWDKERMLALTVRLLDRAHLRIGSERYEAENATYGLTTLRRRHVHAKDNKLELCFSGKSGKFRQVTIRNRQLQRMVREVAELPGYRLFHYFNESGAPTDLDSGDVNDYLHRHMGEAFSAKDFRTWGGTSFGVKFYPDALRLQEESGKGKLTSKLVKLVAKELGNTVSVCRTYYIHPDVLTAANAMELPSETWETDSDGATLARYERATLDLIRGR